MFLRQWCNGSFCDNAKPLIAAVHDGSPWFYPHTVFENLNTILPNFQTGYLRAASCFGSGGNAICIASGTFYTPTNFLPMIAHSFDGARNWHYPETAFTDLTTAIDPNFVQGSLSTASCTKSTCESVCIASGNFCNTANCDAQLQLLALSTDKGFTWTYPNAIFKNLKSVIDPNFTSGFFISSSCTGTGHTALCVAAGSYSNNSNVMPLLAQSSNGGATWTYPPDIFEDLANRIGHRFQAGFFNAASCSGSGAKAVCIAAGSYATRASGIPFLAQTRDGGAHWTYPDFIYTKLKTLVDPDFIGGTFEGANCIGTGKQAICMAAGLYCTKERCLPLLALTQNGGKTWSYPPSVYQNLTTRIDPNISFGFFGDVNCSGTAPHNFCIASGQYAAKSITYPLLAYSTDGGINWTYPPYVFQNLKTTIGSDFEIGAFNKTATTGGELKLKFEKLKINWKKQNNLFHFVF